MIDDIKNKKKFKLKIHKAFNMSSKEKNGKGKIKKVMSEFKHADLHGGSEKGLVVKDKDQAISISISEEKKKGKK